jgi:hypothetical protein
VHNSRHASLRLYGSFVIFFTKIIILAERTQFAFSATRHGGETLAASNEKITAEIII